MTTTTTILKLALPTALRRQFDYLPPQGVDINKLIPGIRLRVPFATRTLTGILISIENYSDLPYDKLKPAVDILDEQAIFPPDVYKLCHWAADYYHCSLGEILASALPTLLRKGKPASVKQRAKPEIENISKDQPLALNQHQQQAFEAILSKKENFQVFLLDGVTGSGKTEVYLQAIADILKAGKQILVLVPEISLTPQTVARFRARFQEGVVVLHSGLTEQERLRAWLKAKNSEAKIVIGTRSAIFTPFENLGLIIVDEEHDSSFKQQDRFRYHARDLAIMRANINNIPIVLGSATPSLESVLNVKRKRYQLLSLPERAGKGSMPQFHLIDLRNTQVEQGLSKTLINMMKTHLEQNNQVMLFLNRRGFAPVLYCTQCAWISECRRCDARMVYHQSPLRLQCHHCDTRAQIPKKCQQCGEESLQPVGLGTQRVEQALAEIFPDVPLIRVDRDSTRKKGEMQNILNEIATEKKAILLGTQMLAKGHHFPNVTLVGIIDADSGLFSADFRAAEQMGQLLMQVSGRAGRAEKKGEVAIQTRHPDHALLQTLIHSGYQAFAENLLNEREVSVLPPFSYFAVFRAESFKEKSANSFLESIKSMLPASLDVLTVHGPVPAMLSRKKGMHCQHLLVKTSKRSVLQKALKNILQQLETATLTHSVKWVLDVDPIEV